MDICKAAFFDEKDLQNQNIKGKKPPVPIKKP